MKVFFCRKSKLRTDTALLLDEIDFHPRVELIWMEDRPAAESYFIIHLSLYKMKFWCILP